MSTKSHTYKKDGTLRKNLFFRRGYAEIHMQRQFFDNKKGIYFGAYSTYVISFIKKIKILILVVFQSSSS
jgi:hypothetical protein